MSEFRIYHAANELLGLLNVRGGEGAEEAVLQIKTAEHSKTPEDFLSKYDELKSKNARNLDPMVYLLYKLTEDKETLKFLQQNPKETSEMSANASSSTTMSYSIPATSSKMSMQEMEELWKKRGNVTSSSNVPQVYDRPALIGDFITSLTPVGDTVMAIDM